MSLGLRAEANNTSAVISVAGVDQVVINNAGDVTATTFTGALVGTAATATNLATSTGAAPVYGARAWVNFNGERDTSGAVSTANTNRLIRESGNVSSVLRNGTGTYTITFTTAMVDANYATVFSAEKAGGDCQGIDTAVLPTASAVRFVAYSRLDVFTLRDIEFGSAVIFR